MDVVEVAFNLNLDIFGSDSSIFDMNCYLVNQANQACIGNVVFMKTAIDGIQNWGVIIPNRTSVKRTFDASSANNMTKRSRMCNATTPVKKDVTQVFKDLNLLPSINTSDDLQCTLCTYKATQKGHLKTHYKLKHLGGADLVMHCSMCHKRCSTKSNLKAHLVSTHKMSKEDAIKLTN